MPRRRGVAAQHRSPAIARVLLTGGGTGGHVYPAIAIAEALRDRTPSPELLFVGTRDGLERTIVPKAALDAAFVDGRPLARRVSPDVVRTVWANALGVVQALRIMRRFRPDLVVATGGYVTFPVILAARALRAGRGRPLLALLEPNAVAGLTNRLVGPLVDEVWVAHEDVARTATSKTVYTGTPVRASIVNGRPAEDARRALGLDPDKTTIVVMGGSQGARRINDAVAALLALGQLPLGWQILHLSGLGDVDRATGAAASAGGDIVVKAYLDDPGLAYAAADVVVCRAGASTLAELAATGTPAILVPYPHATDDHQARNAAAVAAAGAAVIVADAELDGERLYAELVRAVDAEASARMRAAARSLALRDARACIAGRIDALLARSARG